MKKCLQAAITGVRLILLAPLLLGGGCSNDTLTKPKPPAQTSGAGFLFWSSRDAPVWEIYSMKRDSSDLVRLTSDSLLDWQPRWSPDGRRVAFLRGYPVSGSLQYRHNLSVMDWDGANPVRLRYDLSNDSPSWSPDGSRISFLRTTNLDHQLWIVNADGTSPTLVADSLNVSEISWTPQGKFLGVDHFGIVQFNIDGGGMNRILSLPPGTVYQAYPRMSPDGSRIVFQWTSGTGSQIYAVNSDGTSLQQLTNATGSKSYPVWSPDGTRIAFTRFDGPVSVFTMNADGSDLARVSPGPGQDFIGDWR